MTPDAALNAFAARPRFRDALTSLDVRLDGDGAAPLAVAFSGGGDSLALLLLTRAWSLRRGRALIALTVDHQLRPASADWARWCAARATALGIAHRTLVWTGAKPVTGLAAAARQARHSLLAQAAREAGALVLLMGHTADDRAEAGWMRAQGLRVSDPRVWAPSPIWPEGRDVFLFRPLLGMGRAALREALAAAGETWIDDPANADPAQPRARARAALGAQAIAAPVTPPPKTAAPLRFDEPFPGLLRLSGEAARQVADLPRAGLGAAVLCAGGGADPPRGDRLAHLASRISAGEAFVASLAGARVTAADEGIDLVREVGALVRAPAGVMALEAGRPVVWDGRWLLTADRPGLEVAPLAGRIARLSPSQRAALRAMPPAARGTLPVFIEGEVHTCPVLAPTAAIQAQPLVKSRLSAALGQIHTEAALVRIAKHRPTP